MDFVLLPQFPLQIVVYPNENLNLHIFEPRYRQLIKESEENGARARHVVSGARGVSEWTFVGTRASDGQRVEVDGCDLFTFHGDKIRVKDSWRKLRS